MDAVLELFGFDVVLHRARQTSVSLKDINHRVEGAGRSGM